MDRHDELHGSIVVQSFNWTQSRRNTQLGVRNTRIAELVHLSERTLEAVAESKVERLLGLLDRFECKEVLSIRILIRIEMAGEVLP